MTAAEFAREHPDPAAWTAGDWDVYDHLAEVDAWAAASAEEHRRVTDPNEPTPDWRRAPATTDTTTGETTR